MRTDATPIQTECNTYADEVQRQRNGITTRCNSRFTPEEESDRSGEAGVFSEKCCILLLLPVTSRGFRPAGRRVRDTPLRDQHSPRTEAWVRGRCHTRRGEGIGRPVCLNPQERRRGRTRGRFANRPYTGRGSAFAGTMGGGVVRQAHHERSLWVPVFHVNDGEGNAAGFAHVMGGRTPGVPSPRAIARNPLLM